jgi:DNA mismatch endonuclease, patch repair protein
MRRISSINMKPELIVRRIVHRLGYRYRLHRKDLASKPDLVFGPPRKVIFVHGCFWHGHDAPACRDGRVPRSNQGYWLPKLARNKDRDAASVTALEGAGWNVLVVWECETRNSEVLRARLEDFLGPRSATGLRQKPHKPQYGTCGRALCHAAIARHGSIAYWFRDRPCTSTA